MELIDAARNIGEVVVYRPSDQGWAKAERGVITSISPTGWVFVRYGTDTHAKATHPRDLTFVEVQP